MNIGADKFPLETERKFLIRFPDTTVIDSLCFSKSDITQTYLKNSDRDSSSRVRRRVTDGKVEFTKTEKKRVSEMTRIEIEEAVTEEEYRSLLALADPSLRTIKKIRWCIKYKGLVLEVDVFPFWQDRAFLEIELENEGQGYEIPGYISVIKEVTSDRRYTNRALAKEIPYDELN